MLLLAISTSTSYGSICLHDGKSSLIEKTWNRQQSHAEILGPTIQDALTTLNLSAKDISLIACDVGPGSFTGVRIGVSTAKTLAYANKIPVVASTSLQLLATAANTSNPVLTIMDAQRQEVYAGIYEGATEILAPQLMSLETLEKTITHPTTVVGDGYDLLKNHFSENLKKLLLREPTVSDFPSAQTLATWSLGQHKLNKTLEWKLLEPLYIRLSAAEEKLAKGEIKRHV